MDDTSTKVEIVDSLMIAAAPILASLLQQPHGWDEANVEGNLARAVQLAERLRAKVVELQQ